MTSIEIGFLADHPEFVQPIAEWCCNEWPWYYENGNLETAISYHQKTAVLRGIPCSLVAFDRGELVGTIALLEEDMEIRPALTPWLGCLYVAPSHRKKGIAAQLIHEGIRLAAAWEVAELYAWTEKLSPTLRRLNWEYLESPYYQGRTVDIFTIKTDSIYFED